MLFCQETELALYKEHKVLTHSKCLIVSEFFQTVWAGFRLSPI